MVNRSLVTMLIVVTCAAAPVWAQAPAEPDAEGCKDSSLLTRMPGCQLYECEAKEFDEAEVQAGPLNEDTGEAPKRKLEGAIEILNYACPAKLSTLQVARNAENALKKAGFTIVFSGQDGVFGYRIVTAQKGAQWLEVKTDDYGDETRYYLTAVKVEEMRQALEADASVMADEIAKTGSVAVYGINFDTGKATFQAGSDQVLGEIAKLMKEHSGWRFEVQGHTDNVGAKSANQTLSEQRARAVVAWLTQNGIDASRLVARGYGDSQPVADNTTDEGRARNRRVELKKLPEE